jgi:transposase
LSTVSVRGLTVCGCASALRKNRFAATVSRRAANRKSIVCPRLWRTTLFAAMNVLDGTVIGRSMQRHRHQEFIRFLNAVEREVLAGKTVHAVLHNYAAHKHPEVRKWLARHPRRTFHFTPTSASWLNAVEGFFAMLSKRRLKRGVFRSVVDLQAAINRFLDDHNAQSKPFQWTADPDKITAAVRRGHQALDSIRSHVRRFKVQA